MILSFFTLICLDLIEGYSHRNIPHDVDHHYNTNTPENNRERAFLLQELVATDPVIAKFPTHQVVDAYQQMLRIAPELSKEKEITRAFLRQAGASQAIDPFQAEQLIKANTQLFKQHQLQHNMRLLVDHDGDNRDKNYYTLRGGFTAVVYTVVDNTMHLLLMVLAAYLLYQTLVYSTYR